MNDGDVLTIVTWKDNKQTVMIFPDLMTAELSIDAMLRNIKTVWAGLYEAGSLNEIEILNY